ncbi:MAG: glycine betaine/L-proline ABC transporter substrate-binding protein ProX [Candidatus Devosia phytovorans]|uniref:Glycine betaine/L-proline ABC transporter substrate-binding protein ProX n=1 Tax=Candidatus Devosia phytovorans TaxID=3121372 RepID=A0AAJ5VUK4_9HYPH|nr:glycine betaine/L-proline ABC transporter substrate-binding protein ProX [Devosia sp.]WEK04450.1 MAG: glycine betaine/L-proline ABC transporter substrate-binding protein ProX [Devosia sp.]
MFRLKTLSTLTAIALTSVATLPVLAQDMPGEGKEITLAQPTWDTGWFQTEIFRQLATELGYSVAKPLTLDNAAFYQSVAMGDVSLWVDAWFPLHNSYKPAFEGAAEIIEGVVDGAAMEGYLVDKKTAEAMDITSIADFKRDDVKAAFDRDGDGKADMVACPPGWGCELTIEHQMNAYELNEDINLIKAGYPAAMADALAAYQAGSPILFYTWTPNWTVNDLVPGEDVVWIEVPEVNLQADQADLTDAATREGVVGCVNDPCMLGFPASSIDAVVNTTFLADNPAVGALLEAFDLPIADIYAQNAEVNAGNTDIEGQAAAWIETNRDTVDAWLEAARAAS